MKYLYVSLLIFFAIACNNSQRKKTTPDTVKAGASTSSIRKTPVKGNDICWSGTLNNKIPVFIHYQQDSNLVIGEIIYLNTKDKEAIKLLGTIEDDKSYRLLEFDKEGSITGIILGTPTLDNFNGQWYSPTSKKEFTLSSSAKDTALKSIDISASQNEIAGNYHYDYGPKGYNGDLTINKLSNNKFDFDIISLTNVARGPNIAQVEKDTIAMKGTSFIYKMPYSDSCEFTVNFYKGFVHVQTKGDCMGEFGMGATVDGIYVKGK